MSKNVSPVVADWIATYEHEYGHGPAERFVQLAEHIHACCMMFAELGQKHSYDGKSAYPAEVFPEIVSKSLRLNVGEDQDVINVVADLWQSSYMKGYCSVSVGA